MSVHCVSYDLNKPGQDYTALYEELKKSPGYWHYLDSTWLISTSETATELFQRIKPHIDNNDTVLVIKVTNEYSGWLPEKAWGWLKEHL
ncbi:hypothetical protein [Gilvimarinus chinensis]|uniref:hypothetical protein n=1 Tax=Gilvimarinus chinensis TaxID=396005 RepID=UPI000365FBDF|nr:hypothetical protein [Gilvimarinus chinensis]